MITLKKLIGLHHRDTDCMWWLFCLTPRIALLPAGAFFAFMTHLEPSVWFVWAIGALAVFVFVWALLIPGVIFFTGGPLVEGWDEGIDWDSI